MLCIFGAPSYGSVAASHAAGHDTQDNMHVRNVHIVTLLHLSVTRSTHSMHASHLLGHQMLTV